MKDKDFLYICQRVSLISFLPIRLYKEGKLIELFSQISFPIDPGYPYLTQFLSIDQNVGYLITPFDQYYGIINSSGYRIVIGPTHQVKLDYRKAREQPAQLDIKPPERQNYIRLLNSLPTMPLETFLNIICIVNYVINEDKYEISDLINYDLNYSPYQITDPDINDGAVISTLYNNDSDNIPSHNSFAFEKQMLAYVSQGKKQKIEELFATTSPGSAGKMAHDYIRQLRNTFIVTAACVARAAIAGGLSHEEALSLSDIYIQKCELLQDTKQIMNLQYNMIMDYTGRVAKLLEKPKDGRLIYEAKTYIKLHLTEKIKVEEMSNTLNITPSHLAMRFKQETGATLTDYINSERMKEAQRMLKYTKMSIIDISNSLGLSSQNYFQNLFKKYTRLTPREYREANYTEANSEVFMELFSPNKANPL